MELNAAKSLALELIAKHIPGWRFAWSKKKTVFGCCRYGPKIIELSSHMTPHCSDEEVLDTILHEIAHALTPGAGHSVRWRLCFKALGGSGDRCGERLKDLRAYRYHIMYKNKVLSSFHRLSPRREWQLHFGSVRGRPETKGKLELVSAAEAIRRTSGQPDISNMTVPELEQLVKDAQQRIREIAVDAFKEMNR